VCSHNPGVLHRLLRVGCRQNSAGRLVCRAAVPVLAKAEPAASGDLERAGISGVGEAEILVLVEVARACGVRRQEIACGCASRIGQVEDVPQNQKVGNGLAGCDDKNSASVGRQSSIVVVGDLTTIQRTAEVHEVADAGSGGLVEATLRYAQAIIGIAGCRKLENVEEVEDVAIVADFAGIKVETLGRRQIEQNCDVQEVGNEHAVDDRNVVGRDDDLGSVGRGQREGRAAVTSSHADDVDVGLVDREGCRTGDVLRVPRTDDDGVTSSGDAAVDSSLEGGEGLVERALVAVGTKTLTGGQRGRAVVDVENLALGVRENERHAQDRKTGWKTAGERRGTTLLERGWHKNLLAVDPGRA